ncbi:MAG: MFS transporter [Chloroflexi bacterium]|nr:MFS transporter [Chloroflexota bacterium]
MSEPTTSMSRAAPPAAVTPDGPPVRIDPRARLQIYGAILLGLFLAALDQTVVGTALPRIATDLRGNELFTAVFTAYLLAATVSGPIYGKLSDLYGRRPMMLFGVSVFLIGSLLSGLSAEMWQLVLFRGIQGLGAGALFPIALAVVGDLFSPAERGKYSGLLGAVFGLAAVIGPAIGGILTDTIGWQWVFFVNLPLGVVVLAIIWRLLPRVKGPEGSRSIDYLGALVFSLAVISVLVGFTNKQDQDWTSPWVGGAILLGLALAALFIYIEARADEPIVPLDIFRNRTVAISVASMFLVAFGFFATVVFLPRWFQVVQGSSATESGYQILPLLGGLILSATGAGQIVARTGRYKLLMLGSLVLLAVGLYLLTNLRTDTPVPLIWLWMLLAGLGIGPSFAVFTLIVQASVPFRQLGAATSSLTFFQQVGGTIGLAIAGTIFGTTLQQQVPAQMAARGIPPEVSGGLAGGNALRDLTVVGDLGAAILASAPPQFAEALRPLIPAIVGAIHDSLSLATASAFWLGIGAALVAVALVALLREVPFREAAWAGAPGEHGESEPSEPSERAASPA